MTIEKPSVLLVTDFSYQAKGRCYYQEDLYLSTYLRCDFRLFTCHIEDISEFGSKVDVILLRNTGPLSTHGDALKRLQERVDLPLYNDLSGKADIMGKEYLFELYEKGFAVIPSYRSVSPSSSSFIIKPLDGADSNGCRVVDGDELKMLKDENVLIQPHLDFLHEVSFYFLDGKFCYALYAPDRTMRWNLKPFEPSSMDLAFARTFIDWNSCERGIQRVDACRLHDGRLLLMELEDYNPFLSLEVLSVKAREAFLDGLSCSIKKYITEI